MNKTIIASALLLAGVAGLTSCGNEKKSESVPAIDLANMDTSVRPQDDFFRYVNGGWMDKNPLKPEYSRYGIFDKLANDNLEKLHTIVTDVMKTEQTAGTIPYKIATIYQLGMDSVKLNADGAAPIMEQLNQIDAIADKAAFTETLVAMHKEGMAPYFITYVDADEKNSTMNIAMFYQGGMGMDDRDYYLLDDDATKAVRESYKQFIHKLFTLAGADEAKADKAVEAVMKIETKIAKASYSREMLRDSYRNYNKMTGEEWSKANNLIDWNAYFVGRGMNPADEIVVKQKDFFNDLAKAMEDVTLDEQKLYLEYNLLNAAAPYLSDDFVNANFDFYGRTMSGKEVMQPRWKRALSTTDGALSEALGQLYVERYFPASSKEKMLDLVHNLQVALGQRIDDLEWMSDDTKARAKEKLGAFHVKIGYPDTWRDYSGLEITDDSYWANVRRSNIFDTEYMFSKLGKPVDKDQWLMAPQMVNAYYNPTTNEICFPAAILQPPFFNPAADDAVNYGAIGVVIGHEMTHGFDDQGSRYDKDGNLNNWWTEEDAARFKERTDVLVEQFNAIEVAPGVHANGSLTLGENIADQGGLLVARLAYENSLNGQEERPADIDGFTDVQRFYIGYGSVWSQNIRPEEVLRLTKLDPHSLGEWRVNATLRNIDDFYEAFDIQEGDAMYLAPENRVNVW